MTKTTEELKRVMYDQAREMCNDPYHDGLKNLCYRLQASEYAKFKSALEAYLEALRQELKTSHEATGEVAIQLSEMKAERDELRNKLQAFEFANKNAGELLRDALATVKRQRQYIRTLYTSRKARKPKGGTSGQNHSKNAPQVKCGGNASVTEAISLGKCMHTTDCDGFCTFCRQKVGGAA